MVAELFSTSGSKFVTLCRRLGVGRESLRRTLSALVKQKLVQRNPGYGHPMRPEWVLTETGRAIGNATERLVSATQSLDIDTLAFRKWSLPVIYGLNIGASRFRGIQVLLPSVTSRALSLTLKELEQAGVVNREVREVYPPTSTYELTQTGMRLASLVADLHKAMVQVSEDQRSST